MIDQTTTNETRKPYRKPEIERVRLVPGEAVLQVCKTSLTATGPTGATGIGCLNRACSKDGT